MQFFLFSNVRFSDSFSIQSKISRYCFHAVSCNQTLSFIPPSSNSEERTFQSREISRNNNGVRFLHSGKRDGNAWRIKRRVTEQFVSPSLSITNALCRSLFHELALRWWTRVAVIFPAGRTCLFVWTTDEQVLLSRPSACGKNAAPARPRIVTRGRTYHVLQRYRCLR